MNHSTEPRPRPKTNVAPEIEPSPGSHENKFPPEPTPLAGSEQKAAESQPNEGESHERLGSGEDARVESGEDATDPEQQAAGGDDTEKSFE
jgi:hypothetical protein